VRIGKYYDVPGLGDYALAGGKLLIFAAFIVLAWTLVNRVTSFDDHTALFAERNTAYALQRGGLVLGQAIAMTSLISSRYDTWWIELAWLAGGGVWATLLLLGMRLVLRRLVPFAPDAGHRTVSVGAVRGAFYVAGGLVIGAGLAGSAPSLATALASTVVFTALGLLVLGGTYLVNGRIRPYDLNARVCSGNLAAAIVSGGFLVALGFVLRTAISGDFAGWITGLIGFALTAVFAVVCFYLLCIAVDRWVVTNATLAEVVDSGNALAATIMTVAMIAVALGVSMVAI
jgi:uncharacterized membrane protein YjfL (UPF0719 family)